MKYESIKGESFSPCEARLLKFLRVTNPAFQVDWGNFKGKEGILGAEKVNFSGGGP